jgi:ABC-type nitrate/sulfonate/bicarbonate transport system substrate-binding protein
MRIFTGLTIAIAVWIAAAAPAAAEVAQDAGFLAPPSNGSFMLPIIRELGLDKKHRIESKVNLYNDPSALYADFAAGKTSQLYGAIFNAANFYVRGLKVKLLFTVSTANHAFVSRNAAIKEPTDLKGKTIAATTSSGFYGMAALYLRQYGLDPRRNVEVINAPPAAVQTQLLTDKVEVGLMSEPGLSGLLTKGFHTVGDMRKGVRSELKMKADANVWYIGGYAVEDWVKEDSARTVRLLQMWQEAADYYNREPDKADEIISRFTKLPVEALKFSRSRGLAEFIVKPATEEKANIDALMGGFKSVGFLTDLPDGGFYYDWPKTAGR